MYFFHNQYIVQDYLQLVIYTSFIQYLVVLLFILYNYLSII